MKTELSLVTVGATDYGDDEQGYVLYYVRKINGVPVTFEAKQYPDLQDEAYSELYNYEKYTITIDDSGITCFELQGYMDIVSTIDDNAELLSFDEIKNRFKQQMFSKYCTTGFNITVNRVTFGYMRVRKLNSIDEFILIPVWDFFGYQTSAGPTWDDVCTQNNSLLTINAIDGSVINREFGY